MSMRLMPKSEVAAKTANLKRQEIEAGVKIARRVDAVRDTLLEEEKKLEAFRVKRLKEIHAELDPLENRVRDLKKEVPDLEDRRKAALKPVDDEWKVVREAKNKASHDQETANTLLITSSEADKQAKEAVRKAGNLLVSAKTKEDRADQLATDAANDRAEAKLALEHAQEVEATSVRLASEVEADLLARDNAFALKENGLILRESNLTEGEADLANGWKLLRDREAKLERNIKRAKK